MKDKNPLAALELFISFLGGLMILFLVVVVPASLLGSGSVFGFGESIVCVDAPYGAVASHGQRGDGITGAHVANLAADVHANPSQFDLCALEPSTGQRVLATLMDLPQFLFGLGFLVITWRLTRRARRRGLFMPEVAKTIGRLGVYLFVGEFVVTLAQAFATQHLVYSLLTGPGGGYFWVYALGHFSWAVIIAAFGLQAMGRVMAMTVPMREEIDATV
jgi:Protein of unknown function (DUF2975)